MSLAVTDEQRLLARTLRDVVAAAQPMAAGLRAAASGPSHPAGDEKAWRSVAELGGAGLLVPEAYGGLGGSLADANAAAHALGSAAASVDLVATWTTGLAVAASGTEAQRDSLLPALADGSLRVATVWDPLTPVVGSTAAQVFLVVDERGLALARRDAVRITPLAGLDLFRPIAAVAVTGRVDRLEGADAASVGRLRAVARALVAADAAGIADHALDQAVSYAKVRRQFGRPIGQFQAVKHQLADLATSVAPLSALARAAAVALDDATPDSVELADIAKAHVCDVAVSTVRSAIEIHGGFGYTWECPLHAYLRRAMLDRQLLGDPRSIRREQAARRFGR